MKLLDDIKAGIESGDWKKVCSAYNKITGDNIAPPKIETVKVFNSKTANKRELYNWLSERRTLNEYKKYTTESLRSLVETFELLEKAETEVATEQVETQTETFTDNQSAVTEFSGFYVKPDKLTVGDLKQVEAGISEDPSLKKFIESGTVSEFTPKPKRPEFQLQSAQCIICNKVSDVHPDRINSMDGKKTTTCDTCIGSKR